MASLSKNMKQLPVKWNNEDSSEEYMVAEVDPSIAAGNGGLTELPYDMSEWTADEVAAYNALRSKRKKCCIGGCTPRSLPIARSYHQLPVRNEETWRKWVEVIRWSRNEPEWSPNGDAAPLVCSRHFPDSDFISYEASSRVRLSHTAVPINYVDPPEGTEMDPRFSEPLPFPPIIPNNKLKGLSKAKKVKEEGQSMDDEQYNGNISSAGHQNGSHRQYDSSSNSPQYEENYGYDIEEVNEERYDDHEDGSVPEQMEENYYEAPQIICKPVISLLSETSKLPQNRHSRLSAPTPLIHYQKQKTTKQTASIPKPPGLIRATFVDGSHTAQFGNSMKSSHMNGSSNSRSILKKDIQPVANRSSNHPTKHKIGLAKCRLIVQTLENQLKIAKMRLAEQLDIPYQVVHGVWNMKDTLKDKL